MTGMCGVRGCPKRSIHVARVLTRNGSPYAGPVLRDEILKALLRGESVPLCAEHYVWFVDQAKDLATA